MRATLLLAVLALSACDDAPPAATSASSSPSASVEASTTPARAPAPPIEADPLDVAELKRAFSCAPSASTGPCRVLAQFTECIPWDGQTQSGDGRWLGRGYVASDGKHVDEYTVVRSKRGAATPGQLPVKVAISSIPDDRDAEQRHAKKAVSAYERYDVPAPNNTAVRWIKERSDWPDSPAMKAGDNQLYVTTGAGAHLCMRKDQRLVLIRRAATREHPGDGLYVILHPVSW